MIEAWCLVVPSSKLNNGMLEAGFIPLRESSEEGLADFLLKLSDFIKDYRYEGSQ